jgi:hypothetical protein
MAALRPEIRSFLRKFTLFSFSLAAILLLIAYAVDYARFRYRLSANHQPFGQITVITYYAVGEKGNKVEYMFNPPQAVTCVNSLFPHSGYTPCWYLQRHKEQRTDI